MHISLKSTVLFPALLVLSSHSILAQAACESEHYVTPCMVGIWSGQNDMVERMRGVFASLPPNVVASIQESSGKYLFLRVEPNARFVTSPVNARVDMEFLAQSGGAADLMIAVDTYGQSGFLTAGAGDELSFCKESGGPDTLTTHMEAEGESTDNVAPIPGFGTTSVPMRYECMGDTMNIFMDLPPPVGTITYSMLKVDQSAIPADILGIIMGD